MLSEKDRVLYAYCAYVGEQLHEKVQKECKGINIQVYETGYRNKPLTAEAKASNGEKCRVRARVEHVFGQMKMSLAGTFCRTIGTYVRKRMSRSKILPTICYGTPI
jgi:hypothetical protein